jgi:hypothetical protein
VTRRHTARNLEGSSGEERWTVAIVVHGQARRFTKKLPLTPGCSPNVGNQLGEHVASCTRKSGSTGARPAPIRETVRLASRVLPAAPTAVTWTLSAASGTWSANRYQPSPSVTALPPALLTTAAPTAGVPSGS